MISLNDIDLSRLTGDYSVWLEDLSTGESTTVNPDTQHIAASVIKLAVMLYAFKCFEDGTLDPNALYEVRPEDKVPSCGAFTYMHDGLKATYLDIVTLMIILSDNTATNIMIRALGIPQINSCLDSYSLSDIRIRRCMFDSEASARGLQNTITARSIAAFYRLLYTEQLVSPAASRKMLQILSDQRLNGKIPFFLHPMDIEVAHKTGEDDGTSHDTGIVFAEHHYICVFLSNNTDVPIFERFIQDTSLALVR